MALAIDASTPAYTSHTSTPVSNLTTGTSFTPPVGSLLVVMTNLLVVGSVAAAPTNSAGAVTWDGAVAVTQNGNNVVAWIWRGKVTTSASMTVNSSWSTASSSEVGLGVAVITGQAASQTGAATGTGSSASGTPTVTTSALAGTNSIVVANFGNNTNQTVGTPAGSQSLTFNAHSFSYSDVTNTSSGWAQWLATGASGGTQQMNDTAPTGIQYGAVALEILSAGGTSFIAQPPLVIDQARVRASFY